MIALASADSTGSPGLPKSPQASAARATFNAAVTEADRRNEDTVQQAKSRYLDDLRGALDIAMKAENLQEANRVKLEIESVQKGDSDQPDPPRLSAAISARSRYLAATTKAAEERRRVLLLARRQYLSDLEAAKRTALLTLKDLDEANRIAVETDRVKALEFDQPNERIVDLLKLVDVSKDALSGVWIRKDNDLICQLGELSRIEFPYIPPAEYDYRIRFVINHGSDCLDQICASHGHQFSFSFGGLNNTTLGFRLVGGNEVDRNSTTRKVQQCYVVGRPCTLTVKVRKNKAEVYVDKTLISAIATDFTNLSLRPDMRLHGSQTLGLLFYRDAATVEAAEVVEIQGQGKSVR
jgi:hypothetical protein